MLLRFRVSNFRSIKDEVVLALSSMPSKPIPHNRVQAGAADVLRTAAVYGPNASGKSTCCALAVMDRFVETSATKLNLGEHIPDVVPFRLAADTREAPSMFEVTVQIDGLAHYASGSISATSKLVYA